MKHTKQLLALLLTLAMALGLGASDAFAQEAAAESTVNWDDFYIVTQPQGATIPYGDSFTLDVEVNLPEGVVVNYDWLLRTTGVHYQMSKFKKTSDTTSSITLRSNASYYPPSDLYGGQSGFWDYYVFIVAYEEDADGNLISSRNLRSETVRVTAEYDVAINLDITAQPQDLKVKNGESFALSVQAETSDGIVLAYQWYHGSTPIEGATSPELHLDAKNPHYPPSARVSTNDAEYHCKITAQEKDSNGSVLAERTVRTRTVRVRTIQNIWDKLYGITVKPVLTLVAYAVSLLGSVALLIGWPFIALWSYLRARLA